MPVTLSAPGPLWYRAVLISAAQVAGKLVGSFQVIDAAGDYHHGLALDGITPQPLLDVAFDPSAGLGDIRIGVDQAMQALVIAEFGGDLQAAIAATIAQGIIF